MKKWLMIFFSRRGLLYVVLGMLFVLLLACISLVYWIPKQVQKRWERAEARLAAENLTTNFWDLQKQPLPVKGNFFNLPELLDLPLEPSDPMTRLILKSKRDDLLKLSDGLKIAFSSGTVMGTRIDLEKAAEEFVSSGFLKVKPNKGDEARAIRSALAARPLILKLVEQAKVSTHAEFIPAISQRPRPELLIAMPAPHFNAISMTARPLALHGMMCSEMGDVDAALLDFRAMNFLADASQKDGTMISSLVGVTIWAQAMSIAWSVLERRQLSLEQLQQFESWLLEHDHQAALLHVAKGELAMGLEVMDSMVKNPKSNLAPASHMKSALSGLSKFGPFVMRMNKNVYTEVMLDGFVLPLKNGGFPQVMLKGPEIDAALSGASPKWLNFDKIYALLMVPTTKVIVCMYLHSEVQRRQVLIACALERFFLQHHRYPATLAELPVPPFNDPLSGRPFSYKLTPNGRYQIWAFGFDGKDDSGQVPLLPDGKRPSPSKETFLGDWTWSYPAEAK